MRRWVARLALIAGAVTAVGLWFEDYGLAQRRRELQRWKRGEI